MFDRIRRYWGQDVLVSRPILWAYRAAVIIGVCRVILQDILQ